MSLIHKINATAAFITFGTMIKAIKDGSNGFALGYLLIGAVNLFMALP